MTAPASPLRLRPALSAPSGRDSFATDSWMRKEPARLSNMAGALFLATLTALSGSALYAFSRGPAATPIVHVSSRLASRAAGGRAAEGVRRRGGGSRRRSRIAVISRVRRL